jgi:hypothetical protein
MPPRIDQSHGRIEVGSGDGTERENQGDQRRTGCGRVGKKRDGDVAGGEALAHDAGADDYREEQSGADGFGEQFFFDACWRRRGCHIPSM